MAKVGNSSNTVSVELPSATRSSDRSVILSSRSHAPSERLGEPERFVPRERWSQEVDSIFCLIAFAVDISNVGRFTSFFFACGGPAYLVPYFYFLLVCAFPLLYLELILGQYFQEGLISVWKIVPILKGIGYCITTLIATVMMYYMTPMLWALVYLVDSFDSTLPWTTCNNLWNTPLCIQVREEAFYNRNTSTNNTQTAGYEYFKGRVLQIYSSQFSDPETIHSIKESGHPNSTYGFTSPKGLGSPSIELALYSAMFIAFMYIFLYVKIKWTGYLARFTATLPFAVLAVLFFRGLVLEGALEGVTVLFTPNWNVLYDPSVPAKDWIKVWIYGAIQVFYSLGGGFDIHLSTASHNHFRQNIWRDSIVTTITNTVTSLFSSIILFEYIGHLAHIERKSVNEVFQRYTVIELIFVAIPDATGQLPGGVVFSFMFFVMIVTITFDTFLTGLHAVVFGFTDEYRGWMNISGIQIFTFSVVALGFVINLLSLTRGGLWFYSFLEQYAAGVSLCAATLIQTLAVSWIWGLDELCIAAETMTGRRPGLYLRLCWKFLAPISLFTVLVYFMMENDPLEVEGQPLPPSAYKVGRILTYLAILWVPAYATLRLVFMPQGRTIKEKLWLLLCPVYEHAHILETGSTGKRLTLKHLFYFGPIVVCNCKPSKRRIDAVAEVEAAPNPIPKDIEPSLFLAEDTIYSTTASESSETITNNRNSKKTLPTYN